MGILVIFFLTLFSVAHAEIKPGRHDDNETTTCEEFGRYARFNPHSILDIEWMMFYYWGPEQRPMYIKFTIPTKIQRSYLKYLLDGHLLDPINWSAVTLLMTERSNVTYLLVEEGDRGQYRLYTPYKGLGERDLLPSTEIRIKQIHSDRYVGLMFCAPQVLFAFTKTTDIPKKIDIQDAAAKFGFRGPKGKSYLYQGHNWMPIPEADDISDEMAAHIGINYTKH